MNFIKLALFLTLSCSALRVAKAASMYTLTCPKCNYKVRLRTGSTKANPDIYSVYFCKSSNELLSFVKSEIKSNTYCESGLVPFDPKKEDAVCPVCEGGGEVVISEEVIAC